MYTVYVQHITKNVKQKDETNCSLNFNFFLGAYVIWPAVVCDLKRRSSLIDCVSWYAVRHSENVNHLPTLTQFNPAVKIKYQILNTVKLFSEDVFVLY